MDPVTRSLHSATGPGPGDSELDLTGKTLGDFQVLRRLGAGGMGQVYLAEQLSLKRKVALKILRAELAADSTALQRFKLEAEAVARATHANIVQVYAIGACGPLHYMALEYVEGRTLREYVEKKGPPEVLVVLSIMRQVAAALQRASELGIIHRDIKPENILLTRKGEVKVADFGLSRCFTDTQKPNLTRLGVAMGTPLYMSPEQVEGRSADPRTDIYSFGVTCYYLLAGQPPFTGQNPLEVAAKHVREQPRPLAEIRPDLPAALCGMVHKMMAKQPEQRYQTGRELLREVAQLRDSLVGVTSHSAQQTMIRSLSGQPAPLTGKQPAAAAPPPSPPRRRWVVIGSIPLALAAGGLIAWLGQPAVETPTPPAGAGKAAEEPVHLEPLLSSQKEREQLLLAELKRYANPGNDRERIAWGLKYATELGLLYLDAWRLDEAEQLFKDLDQAGRLGAYRILGQLGQAVVLAFRDRPAESNQLFQKVNQSVMKGRPDKLEKEKSWYAHLVRVNRQFRRTIARALDHNYDNDPAHFPRDLQPLRLPPGSFATPRGKGL
jgi:serine/threonine-protein kinase